MLGPSGNKKKKSESGEDSLLYKDLFIFSDVILQTY